MVQRQDVEFAAEGGVMLRGWLFVPDGPGPHPAITMAHGFAGVKEHGLERFARVFADAGFVVLVHDHRGFGASDGSPRYDIDPWVQIADWRRAISFLESLPAVDADRIGLWGSSYAGGHAIVLGRHRPAAARGGRPGAHHQRIPAEPATRCARPGARPRGGLRRRRTPAVPRRATGHPGRGQRRPRGAGRLPRTRRRRVLQPACSRGSVGQRRHAALHPRGADVRAGNLGRPGLPHSVADGRGPARHHHPHRPCARRLRSARCSPSNLSPSTAVTSTRIWRASPTPAAPRSPGSPSTSSQPENH